MRIVTDFHDALFLLVQTQMQLGNQFIPVGQLLSRQSILLFQLTQSFFCCHIFTLHPIQLIGKSQGYLGNY